jgi:glycosyltransferase involved in cell wall biosynthesis
VKAADIAICYNGVDDRDFHPPADRAASRQILPPAFREATFVIGTVAALRPEKDLGMLIEAFARVQKFHPGARLLIVGDGMMKAPWSALAAQLGVADKCHFEPARPAIGDWMRAIDIYVLCSTSESFSNSLLEAMACGCCPVATRVGGIPEMVEDQKSGLLIESGKVDDLAAKLTQLIEDRSLRESLAAGAVSRAHGKFSVQAFARNMQDIYLSRFRKIRPDWPC